jgi:hypothetical protein
MQQTLCAIPKDQVIRGMLFITLTYPGAWSRNARVWKRDLDAFGKRFRRQYPRGAFVWKLEPQPRRKAPHYHLIVVGLKFIAKDWLSRAWYDVVASGDPKHLVAGTQVQLVQSHRGVLAYAAKYTAKRQELPADWREPGRWWGVVNRADLGIVWGSCSLSDYQFWAAVRILRRLIAGRRRSTGRSPPRACHSGMWAVLTHSDAERIARCVRGTDRIGPPTPRHEYTPHPGGARDCLACSRTNGRSADPTRAALPQNGA